MKLELAVGDDALPSHHFRVQQRGELVRCRCRGVEAERAKPGSYLLGAHDPAHLAVQDINDRPRRSCRDQQALEVVAVLIRDAGFHHRRHIRQGRRSRPTQDRKGTRLPVLDRRQRRRNGNECERRMAPGQRLQQHARPAERHMGKLEAEGLLEPFPGEMRGGADPRRGEAVLARIGPDQRDKLRDIGGRHCRIDDQDIRTVGDHGHRGEVLVRVVRSPREQARIDHVARRREQQRIAVRGGPRRVAGAEVAAGARLVLHVELMPQARRQFLCQQARHDVRGRAGRKRHDHPDRMIRISAGRTLRLGRP